MFARKNGANSVLNHPLFVLLLLILSPPLIALIAAPSIYNSPFRVQYNDKIGDGQGVAVTSVGAATVANLGWGSGMAENKLSIFNFVSPKILAL